MKERTALGEAILNHWREHCPAMVKDLERTKRLNRAVFEAQERAGELLHELTVVRRMDYQAAWEMAAQEWALPSQNPESRNQKSERSKRETRNTKAQQSGTEIFKPPSRTSNRTRTPRSRRGTCE